MGAGFYRPGSAKGGFATKRPVGAPSRRVARAECGSARGSARVEAEPAQFVGRKTRWAEKQIARPGIGVARFNIPIMEIGHLHVKKNLVRGAPAVSGLLRELNGEDPESEL